MNENQEIITDITTPDIEQPEEDITEPQEPEIEEPVPPPVLYCYDEITKEYTGTAEPLVDPKTEEYLKWGFSTWEAPPEVDEGQKAVIKNGHWTVLDDNRGKKQINLETLEISDIDYLGEEQDGYQFITEAVAEDFKTHPEKYKVIDGVFTDISDTDEYKAQQLEKAKASKLAENATALEKKDSLTTSLGVIKIQTPIGKIDVVVTSMLNLVQITQQPLPEGFLRTYVDGAEAPSPEMTLEQVGAFYLEVAQKIKAMDTLYKQYETAINSAQSIEALEAITIDYSAI